MKQKAKDITIVGKEDIFILPEGETYEGDVKVLGGVAIIKGVLAGDMLLVNGKVKITGEINGKIIGVYSKLFLSGVIKEFIGVYSDIIFDGGRYDYVKLIACRTEVIRSIRSFEVSSVAGPFLSAYLGLLLGYFLAYL